MKFPRLILALPLAVAACSGTDVQETLGIARKAPDEFVVYSRPPLSVPPEFDLAPPQPGAPALGTSTEEIARETLLGSGDKPFALDETRGAKSETESLLDGDAPPMQESLSKAAAPEAEAPAAAAAPSPAEAPVAIDSEASSAFFEKLGTGEAQPDIRQQLGEDALKEPERKKDAESLYEQIMGEDDEPVVDAKGEAERLRKNKDEGKPVTEGETPNADEGKTDSVIDQIF